MLLAWPTTTLTVTQLKPELVRVPPAPSVPEVCLQCTVWIWLSSLGSVKMQNGNRNKMGFSQCVPDQTGSENFGGTKKYLAITLSFLFSLHPNYPLPESYTIPY